MRYKTGNPEYDRYIHSAAWRKKADQRLEMDDHICQVCGREAADVHHLTYDRFRNEDMGDLVSLCREWRMQGETRPILFLTAKDEEFDVVRALDSGGNDYVTKPFRMQELLSRLRVLLRNSMPQKALIRDGFTVDEARMQISKDGAALPLTLTEYKILAMLLKSKGVVPREQLLSALWDEGGKFIDDNTLSVHMSRLREKVGAERIRTVRGVGYQWQDM